MKRKRIKAGDLMPWFLEDHGTLPQWYLDDTQKFFDWLQAYNKKGWARRAQAQKNKLIVDRQPGTCYSWDIMGLEIIILNLFLIASLFV